MSSKSSETAQNFHYRLLLGCLEAVTLVMAHVRWSFPGRGFDGAAASARDAPKRA